MCLISCVLLIVFILLTIDQSAGMDTARIFMSQSLTIFMVVSFIYWYFSENLSANSIKIGDVAYDSLWYEMPVKQQKAIILMIARSQGEFRLTGLGMIECSFVTFLAVMIHFLL